jgi:hypothetical protein
MLFRRGLNYNIIVGGFKANNSLFITSTTFIANLIKFMVMYVLNRRFRGDLTVIDMPCP